MLLIPIVRVQLRWLVCRWLVRCWLAPSCLWVDVGANVDGIIIIVVSKLSLDLLLTNLLKVNWCPYIDPLPLLRVSGLLLAASSGSDLVAMYLRYGVWFWVIRGDMFLWFLLEKYRVSHRYLVGFDVRFVVLV